MMGNDTKQFKAEEDDCVYFYDKNLKKYRKVCDIESPKALPHSVRRQIMEEQAAAEEVLGLPL
jgi:hypothetical protein